MIYNKFVFIWRFIQRCFNFFYSIGYFFCEIYFGVCCFGEGGIIWNGGSVWWGTAKDYEEELERVGFLLRFPILKSTWLISIGTSTGMVIWSNCDKTCGSMLFSLRELSMADVAGTSLMFWTSLNLEQLRWSLALLSGQSLYFSLYFAGNAVLNPSLFLPALIVHVWSDALHVRLNPSSHQCKYRLFYWLP